MIACLRRLMIEVLNIFPHIHNKSSALFICDYLVNE